MNKKLLVAFVLVLVVLAGARLAYAAWSFGSAQSGSVNGPTPVYSYTTDFDFSQNNGSIPFTETTCHNGSCSTVNATYPGSGPTTCEAAAAASGLSDTSAVSCTKTHDTVWNTPPPDCSLGGCGGIGGGGGGGDGGIGSLGGELRHSTDRIEIFSGIQAVSSSCRDVPVQNGGYDNAAQYAIWYHEKSCTTATQTGTAIPTAMLTPNPDTIVAGNSSALTYSCTNSTSASISGVGAVMSPSGTVSVSPGATTSYTLTCTGAGGSATASATVTVIPSIVASCTVSPTAIVTGASATWTANTFGGTGSYTYSWSGTDSLSGSGSSVTKPYGSSGAKTGSVTVTSGTQSTTVSCSNNVTVTDAQPPQPPPPSSAPTSCTVNNANPTVGATVTYTANGGTAPYSWTPSGGTGPGSSGNTTTRTYSVAGPYTMQVSGNGSSSITCDLVTAGALSCGTAHVTITATPNRVRAGQTSTISWTASGVDSSCTISGPGVSQSINGASCVIPNGSATPTITQQSVYTISCDGGETTAQAVVNLIPKFIEF